MLLAAVWFGTLGQRALIRPDEGRYAEIPREMSASGDWLTPRLNDIKYFEKPALQYWATAAGFKVFGESEWTARLWPALTGFFSILLVWWTGRRLWGAQAGNLAAAILASSLLFVVMGHLLTLDMGLSFFLQVAWTGFLFAQQEDRRASRRWMLLAWAGLALAVLSKGIVALALTGATLVGYTLLNRDLSPWKRLSPFIGLALFLIITAPWFVAVSLANPEFPHFFFIHEHFERFLTTAHRRDEPAWFFLAVYALGVLPWTFVLLHALPGAWRRRVAGAFSPERFLLVWVLTTFAFFNVSGSKMAPYILPIFPALALLGGRQIAGLSRRSWLIHLGVLAVAALAGLVLAPGVRKLVGEAYSLEMIQALANWLAGAATLFLLAILAAALLVWYRHNVAAATVLAVGACLGSTALLQGHDELAPYTSARGLVARALPRIEPGLPFYSVLSYEQTLPFYLRRTLTLVANRNEMGFGLVQEPQKWIATVDEFKARWRDDRQAYAAMKIDVFERLVAEGLPMAEIARDRRYVIAGKSSLSLASHATPGCDPAAPGAASPSPDGSLSDRPCNHEPR